MPLARGAEVGDYQIVEVIGYGGFSVTYLARDRVLERTVVLKEYAPRRWSDRDDELRVSPARNTDGEAFRAGLQAFVREARTLAAFRHPNIVQIHRILEANDTAYIVMAHEGGENLEALLARGEYRAEPVLRQLALTLLDALEYVHRAGVLHRDLKPTNILINADGEPKLFDFGAARQPPQPGVAEPRASLTAGYAPYEQYTGSGIEQGPWTDIYAFGATLHRALVGKAPPDARTRGHAVRTGRPDPYAPLVDVAPVGYSREFLGAVDWALAFDAADRPRSCTQLRRRLRGSAPPAAPAAPLVTEPVTEHWAGVVDDGEAWPSTPATPATGSWSVVADHTVPAPLRDDHTVPAPTGPAVEGGAGASLPPHRGPPRSLRIALVATTVLALWLPGALHQPAPPPVVVSRAVEPAPQAEPPPPSPEEQAAAERRARIETLLLEAARHAAAGRLDGDPPPHALSRYREVLQLDPGNEPARSGIEAIVEHYAQTARESLGEDPAGALALAGRGLAIDPGHSALAGLRAQATSALEERRLAGAQQAREAARRDALAALAATAERQFTEGRLTAPPGDNALESLERLLGLEPGDARALRLRGRIAERYAADARAALAARDRAQSARLVDLGLRVEPGHPALLAIRAGIEQQAREVAVERERARRESALAGLLEKAAEQVRQGRYTSPEGDNAWHSYREALALDPTSRGAEQGMQRLVERLQRQAEEARDRGDPVAALAWIDEGARVQPHERWERLEASLAGLSLRDRLASGGVGPAVVFVPGGRFTMGDPGGAGEAGAQPLREARVATLFAGRYEITFEEFDRFTDARGRPRVADELWGRGRLPVVNVNWRDANAYTAWLSEQTGQRYRLPSETEWEYLARAGTRTDYWWGQTIGDGRANCKRCGAAPVGWRTLPVGSFAANPFGLYDTVGNVYEWTASVYPVEASGGESTKRVSRGGSWFDGPRFSRVSMRLGAEVDFRVHFQGFRVVRDIERQRAASGEEGA